jgi:hypothetical protein
VNCWEEGLERGFGSGLGGEEKGKEGRGWGQVLEIFGDEVEGVREERGRGHEKEVERDPAPIASPHHQALLLAPSPKASLSALLT